MSTLKVFEPGELNVIIGEDKIGVSLFLISRKTGRPFDLTGSTEIEVKFPVATGTPISKKLSLSEVSIVEAKLGHILLDLSDANTTLFKEGKKQNILGIVDKGTVKTKVNFLQVLNVELPGVS